MDIRKTDVSHEGQATQTGVLDSTSLPHPMTIDSVASLATDSHLAPSNESLEDSFDKNDNNSRQYTTSSDEVPTSSTGFLGGLDPSVRVKQEEIQDSEGVCNSSYRSIEDFISSSEKGYQHCEFHVLDMVEKNMVCMSCKVLICGLCLAESHVGHVILSINKIRETKNIRDSLNGDLAKLQSLQNTLITRFEERKTLRTNIKTSAYNLLNKIDIAFQQLQDILERKHKEVVTHVQRFEQHNVEEVTKNLDIIRSLEQSATKMIISVEKFFERLDVQSASLLPDRLKEVIEHVDRNHFSPIENKEKYLPEVKFAKFISSIEAVSNICRTIHPEASKVVWSKVTPNSKSVNQKPSEKRDSQEIQSDSDSMKDEETNVVTKGKRKNEDSSENSESLFKIPKTVDEMSLSPSPSSEKSQQSRKNRSARNMSISSTSSDEDSDSSSSSLSKSIPKTVKYIESKSSKRKATSESNAAKHGNVSKKKVSVVKVRDTRSSPLATMMDEVKEKTTKLNKDKTTFKKSQETNGNDKSETTDEDVIPELSRIKFDILDMPNDCCVIMKRSDKVLFGKVTDVSSIKQTQMFDLKWLEGSIESRHLKFPKKSNPVTMHVNFAIAYFSFDLESEIDDDLTAELKVAQQQPVYKKRIKSQVIKAFSETSESPTVNKKHGVSRKSDDNTLSKSKNHSSSASTSSTKVANGEKGAGSSKVKKKGN